MSSVYDKYDVIRLTLSDVKIISQLSQRKNKISKIFYCEYFELHSSDIAIVVEKVCLLIFNSVIRSLR